MHLFLYFCVMIVTACCSATDIGMEAPVRRSRSIVWFGIRALRKILEEARHVPTSLKYYTKYVKVGGMRRADKDFEDLELRNVKEYTFPGGVNIKQGEKGDRLFRYSSMGENDKPTIDVIKRRKYGGDKDRTFVRIVYEDHHLH